MIKAVFFDLDGTLLPLNEDEFIKLYFKLLCKKLAPYGYEPNKLIDTIWSGTKEMYKNKGELLNKDVFWNKFIEVYGEEKLKDVEIFDSFYTEEFFQTKVCCGENPYAREIIDFCKEENIDVFLTTNPIFPTVATETRMSFVNLKMDDFKLVTTYDNSKYTKPNPQYFLEILNQYGLKAEEVILFGNNTLEDGDCASACGIKVYLVGDYIIYNKLSKGIYDEISIDEIIPTIKKHVNN